MIKYNNNNNKYYNFLLYNSKIWILLNLFFTLMQ